MEKLGNTVGDLVGRDFLADVEEGLRRAPMSVRVTPYVVSLVNWERPGEDPLRRQFLPLGSTAEPDHPRLTLDSLGEQRDAPVPGLTHRYPDKALFLALDTCPVYCRFCTRSYAVGLDTASVDKVALRPNPGRWEPAFEYLASHIHSYEVYDPETGVSVYEAPGVKPGERFVYVDPLSQLPPEGRAQWESEHGRHRLVRRALAAA